MIKGSNRVILLLSSFLFLSFLVEIFFNHNTQPVSAGHEVVATYDQEHFWFLDDDGEINSATGYDDPDTFQDSAIYDVPLDSTLRFRLALLETANSPTSNLTLQPQLQFSSDATDCVSGTWNSVPAKSSCSTNPICQETSANFTDGDLTSQRLSDGHTFVSSGDGIETDGTPDSVTFSNKDQHAEWEWMLKITSNVSTNTTYRLRATYSIGTPLEAYTACALLTTQADFSLEQISYRWRSDDGPEVAGFQSAGFINPNGDYSVLWDVVSPPDTHYTTIDEGATPDINDYIEATNQTMDEFEMETISGSGSYSRVDVGVYVLTGGNDQIGINIVINAVDQTEQVFSPSTGYSWITASFTGLSMSQSDLDNIRVKLNHKKKAGTDSIRVATLQAEVFEIVSAATFKEEENTIVTSQAKSENVRARFLIKNNGPDSAGTRKYRLEFGQMVGVDCQGGEEIFANVPNQASCGTSAACMSTSTYFTDQDTTSNISPGISDPTGTFVAGKLIEDPSNEATSLTFGNGEFTELEYNFQFTTNATDGADYCFRVVRGDTPLNTYTQIARITLALVGGYATSGTYLSNAFDTGFSSVFNVIEWSWSKTNPLCNTCTIRLQIQTAPDAGGSPGAWSVTWCGPEGEDGDETDYFTVSTGELVHTDHNQDQWIRYKVIMEGDGNDAPILEEIRINYQ